MIFYIGKICLKTNKQRAKLWATVDQGVAEIGMGGWEMLISVILGKGRGSCIVG